MSTHQNPKTNQGLSMNNETGKKTGELLCYLGIVINFTNYDSKSRSN